MKNVAVAPCKKASEQWVMCRDFFRILTRTLKTEQPARSDTRIEQAFSVSFLVNTFRKHQNPVQERIWGENRSQIRERRASENGTDTGIHDSVV